MSSKITGKEYPLLKIFSSDFEYYIPAYQRPYAWTTEQTETLFTDLYDFYQTEQADNYFLGTIVLIKDEDRSKAAVIDGQQRLTTLTILFSVLASNLTGQAQQACYELLQESGNVLAGIPARPRLHLRDRDQKFFEEYIQNVKLEELMKLDLSSMKTEAQVHIYENCKCLMEKFADAFDKDQDKLIQFSIFLLNRCFLVAVSTASQESAFRVFSVMNSRGLDLLPIDIIKSEVIGGIQENERDEYTEKWEKLENDVGRDGFNEIFSHTRTIFAKDRVKKNLLEEFREYVLKNTTPKDLVDKILMPYTEAYSILRNQTYESTSGAEDINDILYWLNKIDNYDWMPPAIKFLAEHAHDSAYTLQFMKKLERLTAYLQVTAQDVNRRVSRYKWLLLEMDSKPEHSLNAPLETIELTNNEKKLFMEALSGEIYTMPSRRRNYIIQRLDSFTSDGAARYDAKIFTIEHILPQNPQKGSEWDTSWPDMEDRRYWVNRIANLVPLTRMHNSAAQNYDFVTKKTTYFHNKNGTTSYSLTTQVVNMDKWTPDVVKTRQEKLLQLFEKKWDLKIEKNDNAPANQKLLFHIAIRGCNATGYLGDDSKFVVVKGSTISRNITESCQKFYSDIRDNLITTGIVVDDVFTEDYAFDSPSAAAVVVGGRSANGPREWTTLDGRQYGKVIGR